MGEWQGVDTAGRKIAGLLGYTPPAGFYSRMQRAVEAMPEVIQTREIPGLLRKYPEGVPKWEISTVDVPSIVGDRKTIGRQELLDAVQQRSPVFTHGEVVLRDEGALGGAGKEALGTAKTATGRTVYPDYALGDEVGTSNYTELLLLQPGAKGGDDFQSHFDSYPEAVAHMRFARHGDEMVLHELQSDLANENIRRKANADEGAYDWRNEGPQDIEPQASFPLAGAYNDILIKRLAMEAARNGVSDIRFPDPAAVSSAVGMSRDSATHRYGSVLPRIFEKFAVKSGGATSIPRPDASPGTAMRRSSQEAYDKSVETQDEIYRRVMEIAPSLSEWEGHEVSRAIMSSVGRDKHEASWAKGNLEAFIRGWQAPWLPKITSDEAARLSDAMPGLARLGEMRQASVDASYRLKRLAEDEPTDDIRGVGFRMSPEMMRNLLERGAPASILGAAALQRGDE